MTPDFLNTQEHPCPTSLRRSSCSSRKSSPGCSVLQALQLSRDGQYLLTGGDGGVVVVWRVSDLRQLFAYPGCDAGIRAMALSYDQR